MPFWSPELKPNGQVLSYYNESVHEDAEKGDLGISVCRPASVPLDPSITTQEELIACHYECKNAWQESLANAENLRKTYF